MRDFKFKSPSGIRSFKKELRYQLALYDLHHCTESLLDEIALPETTQPQLALTYALAIKSSEKTDWKRVNEAIIKRWSLSGLKRVKELAWIGFEKDFWEMEGGNEQTK